MNGFDLKHDMDGGEMIAAERRRHTQEEGYDAAHDDVHSNGELAKAAIAYILADESDVDFQNGKGETLFTPAFSFFPWSAKFWKPRHRVANLVRAGSLIAAEIDRLKRRGL